MTTEPKNLELDKSPLTQEETDALNHLRTLFGAMAIPEHLEKFVNVDVSYYTIRQIQVVYNGLLTRVGATNKMNDIQNTTTETRQQCRKTKLQIINETVAYYEASPSLRATNKGDCYYLNVNGKRCAVGRCLRDDVEALTLNGQWDCLTDLDGPINDKDSLLRPEYRRHGNDFWMDLQKLHDQNRNWTDNGLSPIGEEYAAFLRERYADA